MKVKKNISKKGIALNAIEPSWAISNQYRMQLKRITERMIDDVTQFIVSLYEQDTRILQDARPVNILHAISMRFKMWKNLYLKLNKKYITNAINEVDVNVQMQLKRSIKPVSDLGLVNIDFNQRSQAIALLKRNEITQNVSLITTIPDEYRKKVEYVLTEAVTEAVLRGRDIEHLKDRITALNKQLKDINSNTIKRVNNVSRDQINKATSVISHARQQELGITKQVWKHTRVGKTYRQSHVDANDRIYNTNEGCKIDGKFIYPAQEPYCHCISKPYIEFT